MGLGLCQPSSFTSAVVCLSIMSNIIRGPIIISAVSQESATACRAFRIGYVWYLLLARSRPGTGLVVCVHPVPPTAVALRASGHAASTAAKGPLASLVALSAPLHSPFGLAPSWLVSLMDALQVCVLGLASTKISKTGISDISHRPQYYYSSPPPFTGREASEINRPR